MEHSPRLRSFQWEPTAEEVREVVRELRPLLCQMAKSDRGKIAAEILRRRHARELV